MDQSTPQPIPPEQPGRLWAMACHLSTLAGFIFPLGNLIVPLIIWGTHKQAYPFVDSQGREAINFQLSLLIYFVIAGLLWLVVIGMFLVPLLVLFDIIVVVMASVEAASNRPFRYPLCIRFLHA